MDFDFNEDKNKELKKKRNVSFEEIIILLQERKLISVIEHPQKEKYKNQKIFIVDVDGYAYLVPFIIDKIRQVIFLKIIFPSRKFTKIYIKELKGKKNDK